MALIISLPIELKHIINIYSESYICKRCGRYGFEQIISIANKDHIGCSKCFTRCCCCDMYVDDKGTFFHVSDKYIMKRNVRTMTINKEASYCDGTKCRYCDSIVCPFCVDEITIHDYSYTFISGVTKMEGQDRVTMHYSCNNCTNKCKKCFAVINKYIFAYNDCGWGGVSIRIGEPGQSWTARFYGNRICLCFRNGK